MENCGGCRFWLRLEGENGLCRNGPATLIAVPMMAAPLPDGGFAIQTQIVSHFPPMTAEGWCGEFKQKDVE